MRANSWNGKGSKSYRLSLELVNEGEAGNGTNNSESSGIAEREMEISKGYIQHRPNH
jgi:hypothetical protein